MMRKIIIINAKIFKENCFNVQEINKKKLIISNDNNNNYWFNLDD